jgi:hypothetical protein
VGFEWIKGAYCLSYQAWEGWLCLRWFSAQKLEHTNWGWKGMLACRRREPWGSSCRWGRPAWADRPGWPRASPLLGFLLTRSFLLHDLLARVLYELHRSNTPVLSFSYIIGPSTWCFMLWVMSMLPCSICFTCHHEFPAKLCFLHTHAFPLHVVLMKVDERASNGACMINFN